MDDDGTVHLMSGTPLLLQPPVSLLTGATCLIWDLPNMAGAFADGARIVIIDDFTNSGSTLFGCAQARYGEMWRDVARCGEMWRDVARYGEM